MTGTVQSTRPETARAGAHRQRAAPPRMAWWATAFGAAVGVVVFLLARRALPDDAYITLGYARNLAEHGHWGLLADRTSNTQTSPLNSWLLAAGIFVTGRPGVAVGGLLVATFALTAWWADGLRRETGVSPVLPYVLVGLLAMSPLLVSTVGLETYLGCAVLVAIARYAVVGRTVGTGILCGLAVLVRPDMAVPAAVLALGLLVLGHTRPWRAAGGVAVLAAAVALPWHLFSWRFLGGFVPDTTWFKTQYADPDAPTMLTAPVSFFYAYYPLLTPIAAVPVLLAIPAAVWALRNRRERWARVVLVAFAAGWTHYGALVVIGAFPQAWYFAPLVACSMLAAAVAVAHAAPVTGVVGTLLLAAACLVATPGPLPWTALPMAVNLARSSQYTQIGSELAGLTGGQQVFAPGEIGALAFSSAVPVIDQFGDRSLARVLLDPRYDRAGRTGKAIMRWNWRYRPDPPAPEVRYRLYFRTVVPDPPGRELRSWGVDMPARGPDVVTLTVE